MKESKLVVGHLMNDELLVKSDSYIPSTYRNIYAI